MTRVPEMKEGRRRCSASPKVFQGGNRAVHALTRVCTGETALGWLMNCKRETPPGKHSERGSRWQAACQMTGPLSAICIASLERFG